MASQAQPSAAVDSTQAVIEELQEMALDPSLEDCCRRDLEQQLKSERIRQALQRDDRVAARQRMAAATIRTQSAGQHTAAQQQLDSRAPQQQQPSAQHENHMQQQRQQQQQQQCGEGQLDDDRELQRLRQQRLRQLQAASAVKQEQQREGFGVLNTVPESSVLKLCCQDPPGRGLVVLHLAVQGHEPCNALDECLEHTADQYRGTYFARSVVSRSSPLIAQLQLPHGIPALLVAKHCALLGKAHIDQFGGADIWDEEVMSYLQRFKVLSTGSSSNPSTSRAQAAGQDGASSDADSGGSDEEAADWQTPCEVCGRTYPHEHIRSIYNSHQQESSDAED